MVCRRTFLKGAGLSSGGLLLPGLDVFGSRAKAQNKPKRFIAVMGALGMQSRRWVTGTPESYQLGDALSALQPFRDRMHIFRGIQPRVANHSGTACFLTGSPELNDLGAHATVDQVIARRNPPGVSLSDGTILRSMHCGVGVKSTGGRATMVYEDTGKPIHPANNPAQLFDRIFAGSSIEPGQADAASLRRAVSQSVLDAHTQDLAAIEKIAGTEDRVRLQAHADGLRTLEMELDAIENGGVQTAQCSAPSRYNPDSVFGDVDYDRIAKAHANIIASSFSCDATRVATLQLFFDGGSGIGLSFLESKSPGINSKSLHDNGHDAGPHARAYEDWYVSIVSYLAEQLDRPDPYDPDGGTILDNSVIYFGSNLHFPKHGTGPNYGKYGGPGEQDTTDTPYLMLGSAGGTFHVNRYTDYRKEGLFYGENANKYTAGDGHVYANRLLVSLLQGFGENVDAFGADGFSAGGSLGEVLR